MTRVLHWLGGMIDGFRPADGPPPRELAAFFRWCLAGAWPALGVAAFVSALAGTLEVVTAYLLGLVIDSATEAGMQTYFADNAILLLGFAGFFVILRPLVFGVSAAFIAGALGTLFRSLTMISQGALHKSKCKPRGPSPK